MEHLQECWDASITDTKQCFGKGLFYNVPDVTNEVGAEKWIELLRLPLLQKSSVRRVTDGSRSESRANLFASLCER